MCACICRFSTLVHRSVPLLLGYHFTILVTIEIYCDLETQSVMSPSLFFLKIAVAIQNL